MPPELYDLFVDIWQDRFDEYNNSYDDDDEHLVDVSREIDAIELVAALMMSRDQYQAFMDAPVELPNAKETQS
jgi:hypothetical protein